MTITANRFFSIDPHHLTARIEDQFFTDLKIGNTFKRTAADRFRDLDDRCIARFAQTGSRISEVLDVGVSSGTTTLALHERLAEAGQSAQAVGTDISLHGYLVEVGPGFRALVDEQGRPLQFELLGLAIRAWRRRADYVTGMVLVRGLLHALSRQAIASRMRGGRNRIRKVRLLSPRLFGHPEIDIQKNDIFQHTPAFDERFDFVRVANILNHGYFDEPALRRALANVLRYLSGPGAWLLVARSSGKQTAATLFRLSPSGRRLVVVERTGGGSEIERLVLAARLPAWRQEC